MGKIILYHGTSSKKLESIKKNGIVPRKKNSKGNWELISKEGFVYLTTAYAGYFAMNAVKTNKEEPVILEVEITTDNLYPDEDYIGQAIKNQLPNVNLKEVTEKVNVTDYKKYWKNSLNDFGNVCFKGIISNNCIKRIAIIPKELRLAVLEPTITVANYKICGEKYKDITKFIFGDIKTNPLLNERKYYEKLLKGKLQ